MSQLKLHSKMSEIAIATCRESIASIDRLAKLISSISLESHTTRPKVRIDVKTPSATSWLWKYEVSDDFSQTTVNLDDLVTDVRDWFDLTMTDRKCFDSLTLRLRNSYRGTKILLEIKRQGRNVEFRELSRDSRPDLIIECN
jgi:hypothetical protein